MPTGRSRVIARKAAATVRGPSASSPSIAAAVGTARRGPVDEPVKVSSWDEYLRIFGGHYTPGGAQSTLTMFAWAFLNTGGGEMWAVRTAHHTDIDDKTTHIATKATEDIVGPGDAAPARVDGGAAPFDLEPGQTLVISQDGGGDETATFTAVAAKAVAAGGTYDLADGETLLVSVNGNPAQTVTFNTADFVNIDTATDAEVAAVINEDLVGASAGLNAGDAEIRSDQRGTGGSLQVTGGTANAALGFSTSLVSGTGNVADIDAVTQAEVKTVVEAAITDLVVTTASGDLRLETIGTGASKTLQVKPSSTAASAMGLATTEQSGSASGAQPALAVTTKDPGAYGNVISVEVRAASNGNAALFDLLAFDDGALVDRFRNLSPVPAAKRYSETVINDEATSFYIRVTDQLLSGNPRPMNQTVTLTGGDDGLTGLVDADFTGSLAGETGLHALDTKDDFSLLTIPDRGSSVVHNGVIDYIKREERAELIFAILDPTEGLTSSAIIDHIENTSGLADKSEASAIFWPRPKVTNPNRAVYDDVDSIVAPPSGLVAAAFARQDGSREGGIYEAAAGTDRGALLKAVGIESEEINKPGVQDNLYDARINPIINKGGVIHIDGTRTLKDAGDFASIPESRGAIYIARSLSDIIDPYRHKRLDERTRNSVKLACDRFLGVQAGIGAFRVSDTEEAFRVTVSDDPALVLAGILRVKVELALAGAIDYVELIFGGKAT